MIFKVTELGAKDIINLADGARLGPVRDVEIDLATGRVEALVLSGSRRFLGLLRTGKDVVVPWEKVKKVGVDAVLVDIEVY